MESVDPGNLAAAGKKQNQVSEYRQLIQAYRDSEISTHVGYIIGFPFDTVESIRRDLKFLNERGLSGPRLFLHPYALARLHGPPQHVAPRRVDAPGLQSL